MPVFAIVLSHREGTDSPHSRAAASKLKSLGFAPGALTADAAFLVEWTQGADLQEKAERAAKLLCDPVLESSRVYEGRVPAPLKGTRLTVMRQPGVMDPAEESVLRTLKTAGIAADAVHCAMLYHFAGTLSKESAAKLGAALSNAAVEAVVVGDLALHSLKIGREYQFSRVEVAIRELDDSGLMAVSAARGLSMNIAEMKAVQKFFRDVGREPSDVELEMVAQTWSEHCKHKTLTGPVVYREEGQTTDSLFELCPWLLGSDGLIRGILQSTIKRATEELARPFCWSVFVDNAGVIDFDGVDGVCVKVETHNHPSAIEPYGGAGTGIGGVIRDIMGTGLGAKPVANTDVFCFGYPGLATDLVPKGSLHPLTVLRGVVSGVRDYGNRMGIPTVNGAVVFDERYTGNPLVYAGCIGMIPRGMVEKAAQPGDAIVAVGGRTGRDGIGGATFSSAELTEESEVVSSGAVQIGNAIAEKVVLDVMLQARDLGLYTAVTDCGAGGFSSAVGEMGEITGAEVELSAAPLKYAGLSSREIWLSEAQERMVFSVPQGKLAQFLAVCAAEDAEAAVLGTFPGHGQMVVKHHGNVVLDMPMEFLHGGLPKVERQAVWTAAGQENPTWLSRLRALPPAVDAKDYGAALASILASPNVCSKEWIIRQYDHEVQARSTLKPLSGIRHDGPSDGAAISPKPGVDKSVVIACGLNPRFGDIDPYWMAMSAVDEAVRNAVCCGGDPDHTAILDNFSWGNCAKPDRLGGLVRAAAACYVAAKGLGTPFISGKDSLNNEFRTDEGTVAIPPTLLITAVSVTPRSHITSMDLKRPWNVLYQIGKTATEFGGSHFHLVTGQGGGEIPRYDPATALACYRALHRAQGMSGLVRAAHDCSEGGLAAALAEMAFAGGLGCEVRLVRELAADAAAQRDVTLLFSESNARIVVEVDHRRTAEFEACFEGLPLVRIGKVVAGNRLSVEGIDGATLLDEDLEALRAAWKRTLPAALGEAPPPDVWRDASGV